MNYSGGVGAVVSIVKWIAGALGAVVGLITGYYAVAYASCTWLWPDSNLCGITGVPAAVLGATYGAWLSFRLSSRLTK